VPFTQLSMVKKKVFLSGGLDMLHSGHICLLENVAKQGDMYLLLVTKTELPGSIKLKIRRTES